MGVTLQSPGKCQDGSWEMYNTKTTLSANLPHTVISIVVMNTTIFRSFLSREGTIFHSSFFWSDKGERECETGLWMVMCIVMNTQGADFEFLCDWKLYKEGPRTTSLYVGCNTCNEITSHFLSYRFISWAFCGWNVVVFMRGYWPLVRLSPC